MSDFGVESNGVVYADSSAALAIANRKGGWQIRRINISTLWIQEKQACHQLELRKVIGANNPADLMTKYLTRTVIDTHLQFMSHQRADGRAQAGLKVQGKAASAASGRAVGTKTTATTPTDAREHPKASL